MCDVTDLVLLDEVDESGPLDLDGLTLLVVERQNKVEEVALPQVVRRLLLQVCAAQARAATTTTTTRDGNDTCVRNLKRCSQQTVQYVFNHEHNMSVGLFCQEYIMLTLLSNLNLCRFFSALKETRNVEIFHLRVATFI